MLKKNVKNTDPWIMKNIAIANKEMIIAGGKILQSKIKKTNNFFLPLDSEHFSLLNSNINENNIQKIFITASGGPLYYNKSINLKTVSSKKEPKDASEKSL